MKNLQQLRAAREGGFTLIELIIVIVIIGILAAVAIPKFTSVTEDAKKSVADGIAGAFASGAATNYAICSGNTLAASCLGTAAGKGKLGCDSASLALIVRDVPTGVTFDGDNASCKIVKDGQSSVAVVIPTL